MHHDRADPDRVIVTDQGLSNQELDAAPEQGDEGSARPEGGRKAPALGAGRALPGGAPRAGHRVGQPCRIAAMPGLHGIERARSVTGIGAKQEWRVLRTTRLTNQVRHRLHPGSPGQVFSPGT